MDRPWNLTYLRNQGTITRAQKRALRELWPLYGVDVDTAGYPPRRLDVVNEVFPHRPNKPLVLEIGFGLGTSLLEMAAAHPERNFIGVEVHKPGIGAALIKLEAARVAAEERKHSVQKENQHGKGGVVDELWVDNVRLVRMDALWLLRDFIPYESLSDACVYFPDPWSDGQEHRRLVNPFLLALLAPCMVTEGQGRTPRLHLSTDDASYAAHMSRVMADAVDAGAWAAEENMSAPEVMLGRSGSTKYEERGRAQGSSIHNFCYRYIGEAGLTSASL